MYIYECVVTVENEEFDNVNNALGAISKAMGKYYYPYSGLLVNRRDYVKGKSVKFFTVIRSIDSICNALTKVASEFNLKLCLTLYYAEGGVKKRLYITSEGAKPEDRASAFRRFREGAARHVASLNGKPVD